MSETNVTVNCPHCGASNSIDVMVVKKTPQSLLEAVKRLDPCCKNCGFHLAWFIVEARRMPKVILK